MPNFLQRIPQALADIDMDTNFNHIDVDHLTNLKVIKSSPHILSRVDEQVIDMGKIFKYIY